MYRLYSTTTTSVPILLTMILDRSSVVIKFQHLLLLRINTKSFKITKVDNDNKKTLIYNN